MELIERFSSAGIRPEDFLKVFLCKMNSSLVK